LRTLWPILGVGSGTRGDEEATMTEKRRPKGEGTIRFRYEGREPPEIMPPGERPRSFYGKSEREVAKKIRRAQREREQGLNARSRQTVAAYLESWLAAP
jgi:hypothetical protein